MKNYILAFMLVPFLLFGQKFKNSELIIDNKEGDKNSADLLRSKPYQDCSLIKASLQSAELAQLVMVSIR